MVVSTLSGVRISFWAFFRSLLTFTDAGHVHSPTGGQGMNTGIQDSFNFGWKLALVIKGLATPALLESYNSERIPIIKSMIEETTRLLRKTLYNDESAWKQSGTLYQLDLNYRSSPILVDERKAIEDAKEAEEDAYLEEYGAYEEEESTSSEGYADEHLRAGDRAPDASGLVIRAPSSSAKQSCQLFQIFGAGYHTVLIFADIVNLPTVLSAIATCPKSEIRTVVVLDQHQPIPPEAVKADFVVADRDGHARTAYCSSGTCGVIIVRPDGMVGGIARGTSGIARYFKLVFNRL